MRDMDQGAKGWVFNVSRENFWRIAGFYEFEELVADGFYFWCRIQNRYPNVTENKQLMGLFKRAFLNHIHDLSKKRSRLQIVSEAELGLSIGDILEAEDPTQDPNFSFLLEQLPAKIKRILLHVLKEIDPTHRRFLDGTRETGNQRLCRIAGLDPRKRNVQEAVKRYLEGIPLSPQYD